MQASVLGYRSYRVSARDKAPLYSFITGALEAEGCQILHQTPPSEAPFRVTFETPFGERLGLVVYAFLANNRLTKNRPKDEHRFQVKYGTKDGGRHELWQDPFGLYTTLFCGINPEQGFFVGADPVLHSPTKFFISIEFKQAHACKILEHGWYAWERGRRLDADEEEPAEKGRRAKGNPVEVLVGGTRSSFLRYIRFEREALAEDQGHRQLIAERMTSMVKPALLPGLRPASTRTPSAPQLHVLAREFELSEKEVLDVISSARRLKMAVRGWVAEEHLLRTLRKVPGVEHCERLDEEGGPDLRLTYRGSRPLTVECKNVLRQRTAGYPRVDFMRTRGSKDDPCTRYYSPADFQVVAACLHSITEKWEFCYALPSTFDPHKKCPGKLSNRLLIDERWERDPRQVLERLR